MTTPGAPRVRGANSLQLRFMLLVFISAALLALVASTVAYQVGQERALTASRNSVEALATAVEKTVAIGAFAKDAVLLQEVAGGLARNELVDVVEVVAADGSALAKALRPGAVDRMGATLLTRPLMSPFDAKEQLGQLRIRLNDAKVQADADREAYTLAGAMAAQAALLALILYLLAARMVSRPIVRLASALRRMTPGSSERLQTPASHAGDEIGVLIAGANSLLEANERQLQTERRLRAEVEAMEAQYRQIFDSSSAGIFVLNEGGRLINGNPTVSRVVGLSMDQLRTLSEEDFIARVFHRPEQVRQMIEEATRHGETVSADLELVQQGEHRRWVHCLISVQEATEAPTVEGVIYDITERKSEEKAVRHRAEHDALTQLKNRAEGLATLDRFVADALARGGTLSVACVDLDGFKLINDRHGHHSGDEVLIACAERMRAAVRRSSDLVARLGGDEFLIALRDVGPGDAVLSQVMHDLVESLSRPISLSTGDTVRVGVSVGVACLPLHAAESPRLVRAADEALYHVKRNGKLAFVLALAG
ncbi:sensor domain-containing diguanylate cyclase [Roseateles asaccharophilus]|uniref:Diguanylate cyclase (GGDEF)-like protein/PAS domain S-box-containing protein n=1 Tax=Roseateles asaccharophilus TaxID=582607 RepID=A0ABU2ABC6_9BURK|nr:sensor domain-containing diguanylate cyclase [Roseateles asaccharophilus]MDR7334496.1 diguanylate cyclase (GGDEF)-like protein/PAS domain S-box-containing protein [Roseateles asaccharophilus]